MGIGEAGLKEWSQSDSESGNSSGGKEKCPYVELPFLSSCMVMRAATVFLNMLCSAMISASLSFRSAGPAEAGNTASIMDSQSLTSFEMSSVVKNGCFSTCSINGNLRRQPVRLSYFFKILARPEWCRMCIRNDRYIYVKCMKWYGIGNDWLVTPEFFWYRIYVPIIYQVQCMKWYGIQIYNPYRLHWVQDRTYWYSSLISYCNI